MSRSILPQKASRAFISNSAVPPRLVPVPRALVPELTAPAPVSRARAWNRACTRAPCPLPKHGAQVGTGLQGPQAWLHAGSLGLGGYGGRGSTRARTRRRPARAKVGPAGVSTRPAGTQRTSREHIMATGVVRETFVVQSAWPLPSSFLRTWGTPRTWGCPDRGERGRQGPRLGSAPRHKRSKFVSSALQHIKNRNVPRYLGISPSCRLPAGE